MHGPSFCESKKIFCDFSVFMESEKASTRTKTKKTKMLMSFKNTFCNKNRQTQKFVLNVKIRIRNVTNQMIVFICIYPIRR